MSDEFDKDTLENESNQNNSEDKTGNEKNVSSVILEELSEETRGMSLETIQKLGDVELPVRVVFANVVKTFEAVLAISEGDIVKLNRFAGEPVDILVGDRVFAKGEITVVDDCFGVRIVDILPSGERLGPSALK